MRRVCDIIVFVYKSAFDILTVVLRHVQIFSIFVFWATRLYQKVHIDLGSISSAGVNCFVSILVASQIGVGGSTPPSTPLTPLSATAAAQPAAAAALSAPDDSGEPHLTLS